MINVYMQETRSKDTRFLSSYQFYEDAIEYILTLYENDKYNGFLGEYEYFTEEEREQVGKEEETHLKPCPFCGREAEMLKSDVYIGGGSFYITF